jgi:phage terminase large subunit
LSHHAIQAAYGGRGSGKSHAFAEAVIESHVIDQRRRTVCVREIQKSLSQSVKRLLELKIEQLGVADYFEMQAV